MAPFQPSSKVVRKTTDEVKEGPEMVERGEESGTERDQRGSTREQKASMTERQGSVEGASREQIDERVISARAKRRGPGSSRITFCPQVGESIHI